MITASDIKELLARRHKDDVFVPECKTGVKVTEPILRMDALVIKRDLAIGYEIKISRSDFLGDKKWQEYLAYCNEFYFVCPVGLIQPNELQAEAGLLWVTTTGTRLYMKKKSARRVDIKIPESVFRYILIHRVKVVGEQEVLSVKEYWKEWLKEKEIDAMFGYMVGKKIRKTVNKKVLDVALRNEELGVENEKLSEVREVLKRLGVSRSVISNCYREQIIKRKLNEIEKGIPGGDLIQYLEDTIKGLTKIQDIYKEV